MYWFVHIENDQTILDDALKHPLCFTYSYLNLENINKHK